MYEKACEKETNSMWKMFIYHPKFEHMFPKGLILNLSLQANGRKTLQYQKLKITKYHFELIQKNHVCIEFIVFKDCYCNMIMYFICMLVEKVDIYMRLNVQPLIKILFYLVIEYINKWSQDFLLLEHVMVLNSRNLIQLYASAILFMTNQIGINSYKIYRPCYGFLVFRQALLQSICGQCPYKS